MFSPEWPNQQRCRSCRPANLQRQRINMQRQRIIDLEERVAYLESCGSREAWRRWLEQQLEPFIGRPELNTIVTALLGRKLEQVKT
jgi:hypothetical protein